LHSKRSDFTPRVENDNEKVVKPVDVVFEVNPENG
jgi:hypothetical protein